jgi:DNA-binding Lrp family transcriptional regulator
MLGDTDWEIIRCLIADARMPYVEIAKRVGKSVTTVANRIRFLIDEKYIDPTIILNYKKLGYYPCDIGLTLKLGVSPNSVKDVVSNLLKLPNIETIWLCGGVHGMAVRLIERSYEDVVKYIDEVLRPIDIFQQMDPQIVFAEPLRYQKIPFTSDIQSVHLIRLDNSLGQAKSGLPKPKRIPRKAGK